MSSVSKEGTSERKVVVWKCLQKEDRRPLVGAILKKLLQVGWCGWMELQVSIIGSQQCLKTRVSLEGCREDRHVLKLLVQMSGSFQESGDPGRQGTPLKACWMDRRRGTTRAGMAEGE